MTAGTLAVSPARPTVQLGLMGGWSLEAEGVAIEVPLSVQRLLAFIALRDRPPRLFAAGRLWPDCPEERAQGNLRSTMWRANRLAGDLVRGDSGRLFLGPGIDVDVHRLMRGRGRDSEPEKTDELDPLGAAELLPGWYDDWVLAERERFRQKWLHALESLARRLAAQNRYADAIETALAVISAEPLRESAHRVLIEVHLAEGNVGEARRAYELVRRLLAHELGLEPSPVLRALLGDLIEA